MPAYASAKHRILGLQKRQQVSSQATTLPQARAGNKLLLARMPMWPQLQSLLLGVCYSTVEGLEA